MIDDEIKGKWPKWIEKIEDENGLLWFPCRDHVYVTKEGVLVSEPYDISQEGLLKLYNYCKENNLECHLTGDAKHHPACIRVEFRPKGLFS